MVRTAFFGTPQAAVPTLERLVETTRVARVVTRPPRPRGRGRTMRPSPVHQVASDLDLDVLTPGRAELLSVPLHDVDIAVVVAYGAIIPAEMLAAPPSGFVNVHFSLLPRWRGAAPVERAILAGDGVVGVSIMAMDVGLDTGPVFDRVPVDADRHDAGTLTSILADVGADRLAAILPDIAAGVLSAVPQPTDGVTHAPKLDAAEGRLDPRLGATELDRRVRAFNPRPGAFLETDHGRLGVITAEPTVGDVPTGRLVVEQRSLLIGTADGPLRLVTVHPEGRRPMDGRSWANGVRGQLGSAR